MKTATKAKPTDGLQTHIENPFLDLSTVAKALGVDPSTIGRWVKDGKIKATRFPYGWKVRKSDLADILENGFTIESEGE